VPSLEEAQRTILDSVRPLGAETVPVLEAVGRVLAEDLKAPWDFPAFDNSAMDGYAVRAAEAPGSARLRLSDYIPAGAPGARPLAPGTAARILTGAPLPEGADAVVPSEEAEERDGAVTVLQAARPGAHVRHRGEDLPAGTVAVRAGAVVGGPEVSWLATSGRLAVNVFARPRVAVLSTGDELVPPGEPLRPGKIYDSNGLALAAAVKQAGAEPVLLGVACDDRAALRSLLADGLRADALVTSAGVSAGDRDLVRHVLEELGVRQLFWKVDIKPGHPTAFALREGTPVFSLPGNPVAALLTFEELVRPALLRMMGHRHVFRDAVPAVLAERLARRPGRLALVRVRLERRGAELVARSAGRQDTGILRSLLDADGIALVPSGTGELAAGSLVEVHLLRQPPGGAGT